MKKLLLADDSITIQKVVKLSFAGEDIEVSTADNGDAAVEAVERIRPDVVLADVFMPGRSGLAVCEFIKSNAHLAHIPVILLVGIFEPFDQREASRVRYDGVLTKPFETLQLLQMVQSHLGSPVSQDLDGANISPESMPKPSPEPEVVERNLIYPEGHAADSNFVSPATESVEQNTITPVQELVEPPPSPILEPVQVEEIAIITEMPTLDVSPDIQADAPMELTSPQMQESDSLVQPIAELPAEEPQLGSMEWLVYHPDAGEVDENCILELDGLEVELPQLPSTPILSLEPPVQEPINPAVEAMTDAPSIIAIADSAPVPAEHIHSVIPETAEMASLSEPVIEDIVRRVLLKLSDQVVRDVAWEVVPELAESIIREGLQKHPIVSG